MSDDDYDIWDEHRWERHINDAERKSEQLREYLESALGKEPPRWFRLIEESDTSDAVDQYIEEELMFEEAYFPDDDDDWDDEDDDDEIFLSLDDEDLDESDLDGSDDEDDPGFDEGDEWKAVASENAAELDEMDLPDIRKWSVYNRAHDLTLRVYGFAKSHPIANEDPAFVEMGSNLLTLSAKLAGGYSFGVDVDNIGANIVYCRKALQAANRALELMQAQRVRPHLEGFDYTEIHNELFELRNDIGVHIQELRDRFNLS
jgi:hypothetical protein